MKLICNNIILGIDFSCYDKESSEFKKKKNVCHKLISIIFIGPVQFTCIYFEINSQNVQLFVFVTFAHTLKVIQIDEKQTFSILRLRTIVV